MRVPVIEHISRVSDSTGKRGAMTLNLKELELELPIALDEKNVLTQVREALQSRLPKDALSLRFAITRSNESRMQCNVSCLFGSQGMAANREADIFEFRMRRAEHTQSFNVVFLVPTGIGCEIGGHAGDATPACRLVSEVCDALIVHPNVVNASDINEMPSNALYVEGSVITRLLMGTVGLSPTRANRVLAVVDAHENALFVNAAVNAVSAARASYGLTCPAVVELSPPVRMTAEFTEAGTAAGMINGLERMFTVLKEREGTFDSIAISSVISVPRKFHQAYFDAGGEMVNPWGGVEAMLTHALSSRFNVPSAHSPMFEAEDIANQDPGLVDPRMAAEAVSLTFFQSVLKGLHKSPRIVTDDGTMSEPGVMSAANISCLVIPDGCIGLPTLAALEQGIPVVAVRENKNLMRNDLQRLPWRCGQFHLVENYWEAIGVLCAIRSGIAPGSVRRPLEKTRVVARKFHQDSKDGRVAEEGGRVYTGSIHDVRAR